MAKCSPSPTRPSASHSTSGPTSLRLQLDKCHHCRVSFFLSPIAIAPRPLIGMFASSEGVHVECVHGVVSGLEVKAE